MRIGSRLRRVGIGIQVVVALFAASPRALGQNVFSLKWAMDDDRYALQYSDPYSQDPMTRRFQMIQEAVDARFQKDAYGVYIGGGGATYHSVGGQGELGLFAMPTSWSTLRAGIVGMEINGRGIGGGSLGVRFHAPTRFTPYMGLAGVAGINGFGHGHHYSYNSYGHYTSLRRTVYPTGLAALVPEAGFSYWITSRARFNAGVGWYVTDGRQPDFLMASASIDFSLRNPRIPDLPAPVPEYEDEQSDPYFSSYDPDQNDEGLGPHHLTQQVSQTVEAQPRHQSPADIEEESPAPRLTVPEIFSVDSPVGPRPPGVVHEGTDGATSQSAIPSGSPPSDEDSSGDWRTSAGRDRGAFHSRGMRRSRLSGDKERASVDLGSSPVVETSRTSHVECGLAMQILAS